MFSIFSLFIIVFFLTLCFVLPFYNWTRLNVSESGLAALVRLSNGDMRKALNILQVLEYFLFVVSLSTIVNLQKIIHFNHYEWICKSL